MHLAKQIFWIWFVLILGLMSPSFAVGAQNAQVLPIGYSEEGRFFSYEEYGSDENSNDAYSKIFVIDLVQISQVVGTPVFYANNLNDQSILDIRKAARAQADVFLNSLRFETQAVLIAGFGDGLQDVEKSSLSFGLPIYHPAFRLSGKNQLILGEFETIAASECEAITDLPILGLKLNIESFGSGREVYTDKALSRSRGCPTAYEIYGVVLPFGATDISKAVALISVTTQEPDGPNRHFLAIPLGFGLY